MKEHSSGVLAVGRFAEHHAIDFAERVACQDDAGGASGYDGSGFAGRKPANVVCQ
jgi:hypothetical protein